MAHDVRRGLHPLADSHAAKADLATVSALTEDPSVGRFDNSGSCSTRLLDRGQGSLYAYEERLDQNIVMRAR